MHILILGGTAFLGRALVNTCLDRGHQVTLFNRGQTAPDLFPQIETLIGDRDGRLESLSDRSWDAVIDTCGYIPRIVHQSTGLLAGSVGHYTFISSLSVYADSSQPGTNESAPLAQLENKNIEEITSETYGPLKAICEHVVERAFPGNSLILRPGLIVGPHDRSDRFSYWPWRVAKGGEILAPGNPERSVQFIDVRDLSEWILRLIEAGQTGIYNADNPPGKWTMGQVLGTCQKYSANQSTFTWVPDAFLVKNQVGPWVEMPLWIPDSDPNSSGFFAFDVTKAIGSGLQFRSLEETVTDTLAWMPDRPLNYVWRAGMKPEREKELLEAWHLLLAAKEK